jgi:hypothetical protein
MNFSRSCASALLLFVAASACAAQTEVPPKAAGDAARPSASAERGIVPCFAQQEGPEVLRIDGVPVPRQAALHFRDSIKARTPGFSDKAAGMKAVEEILVPQAAMYGAYRDRVGELSKRAWSAWERLEKGSQFTDVAKVVSHDPNSRNKGGMVGLVGRSVEGAPGLVPPVEDVVFSLPVPGTSRPFFEPKGILIVKVTKEVPGTTGPRSEQRELSQILFFIDPTVEAALVAVRETDKATIEAAQKAITDFHRKYQKLKDDARIEVVDESFRDWVYPFRRKS